MLKKLGASLRADPFQGVALLASVVLLATTPLLILKLYPRLRVAFDLELDTVRWVALTACLVAVATTPVAFAVLARIDWFRARRGRVMMKPEFWSICCGMALAMAIPAIFAALVVSSSHYDKNRYEFDPNVTHTVLDQGRGYTSLQQADDAVKREMTYLADERKKLVDNVKKLDQAMLSLRAAAGTSAAVAKTIPDVLQRLAGVRQSVGLDGPQQLMDFTAPPVELKGQALGEQSPTGSFAPIAANMPPAKSNVPPPLASAVPPPTAPANKGLSKADVDAEIASVPAPQKAIAAMLPLADLPAGWVVAESGTKHLETFNAENLFEKIDGRAESFIQYDVKGMAYASYHPAGDDSGDVQLFIFEMANPLKAMGKFSAEKPEGITPVSIGKEGYSAEGSTLFHSGSFYTQIIASSRDPRYAAFALELARKVAAKQESIAGVAASGKPVSTPESLFALLPAGPGKSEPKYVAQDVFAFGFLSDVFQSGYKEGKTTWEGFIRPYPTPEAAKSVFEQYATTVKKDGATVKIGTADGADQYAVSENAGQFDVVFRKGNMFAGAIGASDAATAEKFARAFAKALPASVPPLESEAGGNPAGAAPKVEKDPESGEK